MKVGDTVVAAWENGWFPGVVEEMIDDNTYIVSYMTHAGKKYVQIQMARARR